MEKKMIGKITATENKPTTTSLVRFWVHDDVIVRPFDIIRVKHISKIVKGEPSFTYAIIQDLQYITDSAGHLANYVSSDFGDLDVSPQNERLGTTIAEAEVLYNNQEIEMPVRDDAIVEWADVEGVKDALGLRGLKHPIPAGYICMSNGDEIPIEFESSYLIGPEGAHFNIAGISGLATKTSYAMFLMNSIQQKQSEKVKMVIFNVKGSDLLRIDEGPENALSSHEIEEWKKCGLDPIPFKNVTYLYPFSKNPKFGYTSSHIDPDVLERQKSSDCAYSYFYDVETGRNKLGLLFSDIDDPNATMESIAHQLPDIDAGSWEEFRNEIKPKSQKGSGQSGEISIMSWRKFMRLLISRTEHDIFTEKARTECDKKRQILIRDALIKLEPGGVLVIDVEPLPDYLQCLVVGDVLQTIHDAKLGDVEEVDPKDLGQFIIFADELNKYAPKGSESARTLTRTLLDITERGRSLGVILFGAEQFRSGVHDRILGNCSTNVYGRTSPIEIAKCPDYHYFPPTHKSAIARLPQGSLLLQHAVFKTPLIKVHFPRPAYYQPKVK
ncbi:MAG: ATP-binding protein [Anaerolineaceae bacterium]